MLIFYNAFVAGYLRLKRRYRILCIIRDLKTAKAYIQPSNKVQLQKLQSVSMLHTRAYGHTPALALCNWPIFCSHHVLGRWSHNINVM